MGLRELRKKRGLTLEAVSVLAKGRVSPATVSRLERGLIDNPRPETIVRLAPAMGVSARRMRDLVEESIREAG